MVTIRLARGGTKKRPFYHLVVTDSRNPRDSSYIEQLGFYNPIAAGKEVPLKMVDERVQYWISKGAQPSQRVAKLLKDYVKIAAGEPVKKAKKPKVAKVDNKSEPDSIAAETVV